MIKTMLKGFGILCINAVLMAGVMVGIRELNVFFSSHVSDYIYLGWYILITGGTMTTVRALLIFVYIVITH